MLKIDNFLKLFKKILKILENRLGFVIFLIFVIIILYAFWLFYSLVYKSAAAPSGISFEKVEIKESVLDKVMERIELREKNILEAINKDYKDIFK